MELAGKFNGRLQKNVSVIHESMKQNKTVDSALYYYHAGDLRHAADIVLDILRLDPQHVDALKVLGAICHQIGDYALSLSCFQKALQIEPTDAELYYQIGIIYENTDQLNDARMYYERAIEHNSNSTEVYSRLGKLHEKMGKLSLALSYFKKAAEIKMKCDATSNNMQQTNDFGKELNRAIAAYKRAIELDSQIPDTYVKLGLALIENGEYDEAFRYSEKALELDPGLGAARWNMALMHLLHGNYAEGWKGFEYRTNRQEMATRLGLTKPIWDGSDITGRTILLIAEYGLGDTIQFIRYASLLHQQGVKVICTCQRELTSLLKEIAGISTVISVGEKIPEFDVYCPLLSLPAIFGTTMESIPAQVPYIGADSAKVLFWQDRVRNDMSKIKVGLVWAGLFPEKKSIALDLYSPLLGIENITFYSLQKGEASIQAKNLSRGDKLIDYSDAVDDISDTAAFIANLDLIISVDTSVAHLAGALAKPVWTLLPFSPDWRWMLNREDSPWYPTMKLFRQPAPGDWKSVIGKVQIELLKLLDHC